MAHSKNLKLAGRRIIVTGGASGIGKATTQLFARQGADVAVLDIDPSGLAAIDTADGVTTIPCDLCQPAQIAAAVDTASGRLGGIDGLVHCAGYSAMAALDSMADETWRRMMSVNLDALFHLCRAALPWLRAAGNATIVTVASGQAILPNAPGGTGYAASKAGAMAFTKALAAELAPSVRCNVLCPGIVDTPMVSGLLGDGPADNAPFVQQYAMKRVARPEEMAEAILFLSSEASSYITGAALAADGGRTLH
ncbi:SDR family NAD(P)-dependent oxidoreductase [Pacificimonas sp. ICDLI1SI03]